MTTRDRRALIIFGAIVVVAVGAYFLLLKPHASESTPFTQPTTPGASSTSPAPAPSTSSHATPRTPPPVFAPGAKDPFSPLVNPSGGGGPVPSGGSSSPPPPSSPPASPPPTHNPSVSPPASPSSAPPGGTSTHVAGHTVVLLDIFTRGGVDKAQVEVDGIAHTVSEGDTFAGGFELVSIGGTCATFRHGSQQFVLCENPHK